MELDVILSCNFTSISDEYIKFATKKDACRKCSIYQHYKQVGQSEGNAVNPTFMFVGEALGKEEVEQVRPFVGGAGKRLRQEIRKHAAFTKKTTLITNLLACRPLNNKFPREGEGPYFIHKKKSTKKVLSRDVVHWCATNWIRPEIELVKPKVLVTLGAHALDFMRGDRGITAHRGTWKFIPSLQVWSLATYHPSYVMRCENDSSKEHIPIQFAEDIEKIAKTWRTMVNNDARMEMSPDEWKIEHILDQAISRGIVMPEALND